jgi:hypothetical protein
MFRFHSCKFTVDPSKERCSRVVFNKEFGVVNCFTLEASMFGYIDKERQTRELTLDDLVLMGAQIATSLKNYCDLVDQDARSK